MTTDADFLTISDDDFISTPVPAEDADQVDDSEPDNDPVDTPAEESAPQPMELDLRPQPVQEPQEDPDEEPEAIDYEAAYKRLTAPFKANGKDMQVASVDEALTLMQMGANYNKKMAALKPALKTMRLLEKHGLMDEQKINLIIDAWEKNPQAIKKLVSQAGIDQYALDAVDDSEYAPTQRTISDSEYQLTSIFEELSSSPNYQRFVDVVTKEWDDKSKQVFVEHPESLKVIANHIDSGVYDLISQEQERLSLLGKLDGLSSIEAYRKVGDAMYAAGRLNHLIGGGSTPQAAKRSSSKPNTGVDPRSNDRQRKAAVSAPRSAGVPAGKVNQDFNPLAMSDEEFQKITPKFV